MAPATACVRLAKGVLRFFTADVYELEIHSAGGEWYRQLPVGIQNLAAAGPPHRSPITVLDG